MAGIRRTAAVLSVILFLAVVAVLVGCSFQARPPGLRATDVACVAVWVRDEDTWNLEQRRVISSADQAEIERFVEAWATLEALRPPSEPESPDGIIEVHASLDGGEHWTLTWQPAYGEAVFKLVGSGGSEPDARSPMKVESDEMLQLLEDWVGKLVWPPPRPQ